MLSETISNQDEKYIELSNENKQTKLVFLNDQRSTDLKIKYYSNIMAQIKSFNGLNSKFDQNNNEIIFNDLNDEQIVNKLLSNYDNIIRENRIFNGRYTFILIFI